MERQQNYLFSWAHHNQFGMKTMEELRLSLLHTTMELEQTRMMAHEELNAKDDQIMQLKDLLNKAIKAKDEVQERNKRLLLDNNFHLQHQIEEELDPNINGFPSSDGEESIVSSFEPPHGNTVRFSGDDFTRERKAFKGGFESRTFASDSAFGWTTSTMASSTTTA